MTKARAASCTNAHPLLLPRERAVIDTPIEEGVERVA